ncbi:Uncharacterised protein [Actinobacillus pleuropneumoniae]|nr:Uncharacterised protein [Actinobacillus pleuropneumoniae]
MDNPSRRQPGPSIYKLFYRRGGCPVRPHFYRTNEEEVLRFVVPLPFLPYDPSSVPKLVLVLFHDPFSADLLHGLPAAPDPELFQNFIDLILERALGFEQLLLHLGMGVSFIQQIKHFTFRRRQALQLFFPLEAGKFLEQHLHRPPVDVRLFGLHPAVPRNSISQCS